MEQEVAEYIKADLSMDLPSSITMGEIEDRVANYVNELIQNNFQQLVSILYRIDIDEPKLKELLRQNPAKNAGKIIAALIIEREQQKISSRREFRMKQDDISEDEKW